MKKILLLLFSFPLFANGQIITTVAGGGSSGLGDGGPATDAGLSQPGSVVFDKFGNWYTGNPGQNRIRMIDTNGIIHTVAGNGSSGYSGDGGPATDASLDGDGSGSAYIVIDSKNNLIISDGDNIRVREVNLLTGIITTIVGYGVPGFSGDGGPATAARLNGPGHIALDNVGNLYITDMLNNRIRKVDTFGIITTYAGYGGAGYAGDGGQATAASFTTLQGIACDSKGNLYIADRNCNRVRKVDVSTGIITTVAGNGVSTYSGDGIPATSSSIYPQELTFDAYDNMYISDYGNSRIYKVDTSGILYSIAGNGLSGYTGDGMVADSAEFHDPWGVCVDFCGNLYVADDNNERVRKVTFDTTCNGSTTSTREVAGFGQMSIYPNPTASTLNIKSTVLINQITITNLLGQMVLKSHCQKEEAQIDVSFLPNGMYFVNLNGTEERKFLKE